MNIFKNDWDEILKDELEKEYFKKLCEFLKKEYSNRTIFPPKSLVFSALRLTSYKDTKIVIIGQDPYHGYGQANGLCFSVSVGVTPPPSLKNIYKEIENDLGIKMPESGDLERWALQGVLLLNTVLTVRFNEANSHKNCGWEQFTNRIIEVLNLREKPVIFILWGASAREKKELITNPQHKILTAAHPSPLSAYNGFFGCRHFSKANMMLKEENLSPINW